MSDRYGSSSNFHEVFIRAQGVYVTVWEMLKREGYDHESHMPPPDDLMHQVTVLADIIARLAENAEVIAKRLEMEDLNRRAQPSK